MDAVISKLASKTTSYPDDALLRDTLSHLIGLQRNPKGVRQVSWDTLSRSFEILQDRGIWERSEDNTEALEALRNFLTAGSSFATASTSESGTGLDRGEGERFSVVTPPATTYSPLISSIDPVVLPLELVDILNHAYFLHLLATDPSKVLPPGKSLLSAMSHTHGEGITTEKPTLRNKVEDIVHRAFWDEAVESLSNPEPSSQLPRLKSLYNDLHVALSPLLPPRHPVLVTLSSPLSPTSSPLDSAIMHLREVVASLRERCAPARDPDVEAIIRSLDGSSPVAPAQLVVDTVKSILKMSETMKDDLSQFVLGSMSESQLRSVVAKQAKSRERDIVLDVWRTDRMSQAWASWLNTYQPQFIVHNIGPGSPYKWLARLIQSLGAVSPVICNLPTRTITSDGTSESSNEFLDIDRNPLPPVFFFSAPALLEVQNYLQALVIAASLRSLTRLPLPPTKAPQHTEEMAFMDRIWALLKMEINDEEGSGDTKVTNLADEVIRARKHASNLDGTTLTMEEEARLRAAVDRTLQPHDPVFLLLQKRLLSALVTALVRQHSEPGPIPLQVPGRMQTGRDEERKGKRPRLVVDPDQLDDTQGSRVRTEAVLMEVKGFEDPVLVRALGDVFGKLDDCIRWVESIWEDVIERGRPV
ncbi:hypothetical protein BV22DRAFT_1098793 [Leucogyrophana mollusca]|uniref:Uncharacterized protein n=1 Tax=Leucogyrophana mollusca TaxID=85980 RepID=A0ACB8B3Q8_9AGAM|nr:hypothetical protein BV22DRAFT_1098793 [Leucogyrophana mollusca]